jgi:S-adenosylmethionine:tRNA ribosyltransferase-isomerase
MKLLALDYDLPESLIASAPLSERDASRLLVLQRVTGTMEHRTVRELAGLLQPGDLLVVNDARVIPARLIGKKVDSGGRIEFLVFEPVAAAERTWRCLGQASKPIRAGTRAVFGHLHADVTQVLGEGEFQVRFDTDDLPRELQRIGKVPLPPYIGREATASDLERYQTVFARVPGAVAAPTAGLHFTPKLLEALASGGIARASITLLVGPGTFLPVRTEDLDAHRMKSERGEIPSDTVRLIDEARATGGRVVAVGTTVVRALEGVFARQGALVPGPFETDLFIRPGHRFSVVDSLFTNFHLPRSTLLALVFAFAGQEHTLKAYREAVARQYRFYSYGDAMLIQ